MQKHDCDIGDEKKWSEVRTFDIDARNRRVDFSLALTLVHEVAHALYHATDDFKPSPEDVWLDDKKEVLDYDPKILEPFYKDDRLAELGWALEQILVDGVNEPIEHTVFDDPVSNSCTTAYGLFIIRFPGGMQRKRIRFPAESRGSSSEFGIQYRIQCRYRGSECRFSDLPGLASVSDACWRR